MSRNIGARSRANASRLAAAGFTVFLTFGVAGTAHADQGGVPNENAGSSAAGGAQSGNAGGNSGNAGGNSGNAGGNSGDNGNAGGGGQERVTICHHEADGSTVTIEVSVRGGGTDPGLGDHLTNHGDTLGECPVVEDQPPVDDSTGGGQTGGGSTGGGQTGGDGSTGGGGQTGGDETGGDETTDPGTGGGTDPGTGGGSGGDGSAGGDDSSPGDVPPGDATPGGDTPGGDTPGGDTPDPGNGGDDGPADPAPGDVPPGDATPGDSTPDPGNGGGDGPADPAPGGPESGGGDRPGHGDPVGPQPSKSEDDDILGRDTERPGDEGGPSGHHASAGSTDHDLILAEEVSRRNRAAVVLPQTGAAENLALETGAGLLLVLAGGLTFVGRRRTSDC